jgi:hypothetical protein
MTALRAVGCWRGLTNAERSQRVGRAIATKRPTDFAAGLFHTANDRKMRENADAAQLPETDEKPCK